MPTVRRTTRRTTRRVSRKRVVKRKSFKRKSIKKINDRPLQRAFTFERNVTSTYAPTGDIFLTNASYTSVVPIQGACGFTLGDIPATERNAFESVYQQCALYKIVVKFYPQTTMNANQLITDASGTSYVPTYDRRIPSAFCVDQEDADLEGRNDILNHSVRRSYSHSNKPMTMVIIPRTRSVVSTISSTTPVVNNEIQWLSTSNNNYESVDHYGFKWSTTFGDKTTAYTLITGRFQFTYYVKYRYSKLNSLATQADPEDVDQ